MRQRFIYSLCVQTDSKINSIIIGKHYNFIVSPVNHWNELIVPSEVSKCCEQSQMYPQLQLDDSNGRNLLRSRLVRSLFTVKLQVWARTCNLSRIIKAETFGHWRAPIVPHPASPTTVLTNLGTLLSCARMVKGPFIRKFDRSSEITTTALRGYPQEMKK